MTGPYPVSVDECLDDSFRFRRGVVAAVRRFAERRPWRGDQFDRLCKLLSLHWELCSLYRINPSLSHHAGDDSHSFESHFDEQREAIRLVGRISVVTYLHEFAHATGKDEVSACRWSLNLFRRVFPHQFSRLTAKGHVLRKGSDQ